MLVRGPIAGRAIIVAGLLIVGRIILFGRRMVGRAAGAGGADGVVDADVVALFPTGVGRLNGTLRDTGGGGAREVGAGGAPVPVMPPIKLFFM